MSEIKSVFKSGSAEAHTLLSENGYYGNYGGSFIPEILVPAFEEISKQFEVIKNDEAFWQEYCALLADYSGRPTPLTYADRLTEHFGRAKIYVKREDLNHTGAHKLNNALGQAMLAKKMGKTRIIAETGAGQHGVATATVAAKLGLSATIYMGREDMERQYANVFWMRRLGAEVVAVDYGSQTLKDAINETLRDWVSSFETTHYVLGTASGAHPFPAIVAFFQSIIGIEAKQQIIQAAGQLPSHVYACVGGGSNALGIFQAFYPHDEVQLVGVEAGGQGKESGNHAARIAYGEGMPGVAQGYKTMFLQNKDGQMHDTHSIAAGLDYVGVSPILTDLSEKGRVQFAAATDAEVIDALEVVMKTEGLIPALESTHAFAGAFQHLAESSRSDIFIINMSGRGDKDIFNVAEGLRDEEWKAFIQQKNKQYND
ncbi:tryptophan synthase subunit beta [Paenibacillus radicis (ex Xue et al. 2023)]|uniref:Tryptophan synthase beta chain n=1 Tax=Paenibacillus radicis (ex Xue et al. 2023) TaxID=2972489 RepID=A0ABT1YCN7_9BACL|nr:tryptophan synthase subunit beta [Paenibacillus radicis (ex Xue et al. 2023)]MCR8630963.1 tryptophan synthase subunit beta [Paenibacillus radicis (ex Xue et al. 2023)]